MTWLFLAVLLFQSNGNDVVQMPACGRLTQEERRDNGKGSFTPVTKNLGGAEVSLYGGPSCCDTQKRVAHALTSRSGLYELKGFSDGEYWLELRTKSGEVYKQRVRLLPKAKGESCSKQGLSLRDGKVGWWVEITIT